MDKKENITLPSNVSIEVIDGVEHVVITASINIGKLSRKDQDRPNTITLGYNVARMLEYQIAAGVSPHTTSP